MKKLARKERLPMMPKGTKRPKMLLLLHKQQKMPVRRVFLRSIRKSTRKRPTSKRLILDSPKNSRKLSYKDSILMPTPPWLKKKRGRNSKLVKNAKSETTKMTV